MSFSVLITDTDCLVVCAARSIIIQSVAGYCMRGCSTGVCDELVLGISDRNSNIYCGFGKYYEIRSNFLDVTALSLFSSLPFHFVTFKRNY
jgi:hypothetical protein